MALFNKTEEAAFKTLTAIIQPHAHYIVRDELGKVFAAGRDEGYIAGLKDAIEKARKRGASAVVRSIEELLEAATMNLKGYEE